LNNPVRNTDPTGHCAGGSTWNNLVSVFDGTCVRKGMVIMAHARTADEWALGAFAAYGPPTSAALLALGTFGLAAPAVAGGVGGIPLLAAGESISVWGLPALERGRVLERQLGANLPENFPTIDRFQNGVVTSIKSLDLTARTYQRLATLTSTVRGYIDKVASYQGQPRPWGGIQIAPTEITGRAVDLAIPACGATQAQLDTLAALQQYAARVGVTLKIVPVR
jgi:hypothetical protein